MFLTLENIKTNKQYTCKYKKDCDQNKFFSNKIGVNTNKLKISNYQSKRGGTRKNILGFLRFYMRCKIFF
jgi:hypothetical protein